MSAYPDAIDAYTLSGIGYPLPLPAGAKHPPPTATTGHDGAEPTPADYENWSSWFPDGNTALRLVPEVIGIDVDAYDGKAGAETIRSIEAKHGPLPATYTSTSRDDGVSGIRLYRINGPAEGLHDPGGGVELIRWSHRYSVVWPSVHPNGRRYRWFDPDGEATEAVPSIGDLAVLPNGWYEHLLRGPDCRVCGNGARTIRRSEPMTVDRALSDGFAACTGDGIHDGVRDAVMKLVRLEEQGHSDAVAGLQTLKDRFIGAVTAADKPGDKRTPRQAEGEWLRMVDGAERKVEREPSESHGPYGSAPVSVIHREPTPKALQHIEPSHQVGRLKVFRADDLKEWARTPPEFRIPGAVVKGTHGVVGGPKKSLKSTVVSAEMAFSLANGLPWLGHLPVSESCSVLVIVNEGERSYMRALDRIARARGADDYGNIWVMPATGVGSDDPELIQLLEDVGADLVIVDALYGVVGGSTEASSLFAMREVFDTLTAESSRLGFDLWLVHHYKKQTRGEPDLDDLAWAGIAEWADSWLLLTHRQDPRPDEGQFRLGLKAGSRQWGEALYEIDVKLGIFDHEAGDYTHPPKFDMAKVGHDEAAQWGRGSGSRENRYAAILQSVADYPWRYTLTGLANAAGGGHTETREMVRKLIGSRFLVERSAKVKEGGRRVTRETVGIHPDSLGMVTPYGVVLPADQEEPPC